MADIQDSDNFLDLCLKLTSDDVNQMATHGLEVKVFSTRQCYFIVPPKGDCMNDLVGAPCGDSAAKAQKICVRGVPEAASECDAGSALEFTPTSEEISGLSCPAEVGATNAASMTKSTSTKTSFGGSPRTSYNEIATPHNFLSRW